MAFHLGDIKRFIIDYFQDTPSIVKLKSKRTSESNLFNQELFELEVLIQQIKESQKIDLTLNPTIYSNGIVNSFNHVSIDTYFKAVDYQINFFYHLATNYNIRYDLHEYINSFVQEFKDQLSYTDIKITDSGATRIFTNLRFAINDLRNLGLVLRQNDNGKRILLPSVFGLFVLIYIKTHEERLAMEMLYKPFNSIRFLNYHEGVHDSSYQYDSMLVRTIKKFDSDDFDLMNAIENFSIKELSSENKKSLQQIIEKYTAYVLDILEITEDGIKSKKGYEKKTKEFIAKAEDEQLIPDIHGKLIRLLKEL